MNALGGYHTLPSTSKRKQTVSFSTNLENRVDFNKCYDPRPKLETCPRLSSSQIIQPSSLASSSTHNLHTMNLIQQQQQLQHQLPTLQQQYNQQMLTSSHPQLHRQNSLNFHSKGHPVNALPSRQKIPDDTVLSAGGSPALSASPPPAPPPLPPPAVRGLCQRCRLNSLSSRNELIGSTGHIHSGVLQQHSQQSQNNSNNFGQIQQNNYTGNSFNYRHKTFFYKFCKFLLSSGKWELIIHLSKRVNVNVFFALSERARVELMFGEIFITLIKSPPPPLVHSFTSCDALSSSILPS